MVYYIFVYVASISVSVSGGFVVWRRLKNVSGIFFLLFTLFSTLSLTFSFFPYIYSFTDEILLLVSRLLFVSNLFAVFCLVLGIYLYLHEGAKTRNTNVLFTNLTKTLSQINYPGIAHLIRDETIDLHQELDNSRHIIHRQNDFIGVISHEIKSPILTAILQSEEILDGLSLENISHQKVKAEIQSLNTQLVRTGELLSKLFLIQYFDRQHVEIMGELIDIVDLVKCEISIFSQVHKHAMVHMNLDNDIPPIFLDKIHFQQVITNILGNAIKFTDNENPTISITVRKVGKILELVFEDNGHGFVGIHPDEIFDKYSIGKSGGVGLGMGLYLCRRIVELHGGIIEAGSSEKYGGARLDVRLPIEK